MASPSPHSYQSPDCHQLHRSYRERPHSLSQDSLRCLYSGTTQVYAVHLHSVPSSPEEEEESLHSCTVRHRPAGGHAWSPHATRARASGGLQSRRSCASLSPLVASDTAFPRPATSSHRSRLHTRRRSQTSVRKRHARAEHTTQHNHTTHTHIYIYRTHVQRETRPNTASAPARDVHT